MSNYQTAIDKARGFDQLQTAMSQGHAKTPESTIVQSPEYLAIIRAKAASAVYSVWNEHHQSAQLGEIASRVLLNIGRDETWPEAWTIPSKRTIDRRVNEAADPRFYETHVTPIVAVKAGVYLPNPRRFEGRARIMLQALLGMENQK